MKASETIHSFLLSEQEEQTLLTVQERPWSVLQVIPTTPADFDRPLAALKQRGMVAHHDTDSTFCIIHLQAATMTVSTQNGTLPSLRTTTSRSSRN